MRTTFLFTTFLLTTFLMATCLFQLMTWNLDSLSLYQPPQQSFHVCLALYPFRLCQFPTVICSSRSMLPQQILYDFGRVGRWTISPLWEKSQRGSKHCNFEPYVREWKQERACYWRMVRYCRRLAMAAAAWPNVMHTMIHIHVSWNPPPRSLLFCCSTWEI